MNHLSGAPIVMHKKGRSTDAAVLEEIKRKPGITIAEIAESLEWTNGKVDGSVNRLIVEGKASVKHNLKKGMLVKTVYPANFDTKHANLVQIPTELVNCDLWREKAFVYALSRSTIGIAPHEVGEWGAKAFSSEYVSVRKALKLLPSNFLRSLLDSINWKTQKSACQLSETLSSPQLKLSCL